MHYLAMSRNLLIAGALVSAAITVLPMDQKNHIQTAKIPAEQTATFMGIEPHILDVVHHSPEIQHIIRGYLGLEYISAASYPCNSHAFAHSPNGANIATVSENGIISILQADSGKLLKKIPTYTYCGCYPYLQFFADSTSLALISNTRKPTCALDTEHILTIWQIKSGALIKMLAMGGFTIHKPRKIYLSHDDKYIAVDGISHENRFKFALTKDYKPLGSGPEKTFDLCAAFSKQSDTIAFGSDQGFWADKNPALIFIIDIKRMYQDGFPLASWAKAVTSIAYSHDDTHISYAIHANDGNSSIVTHPTNLFDNNWRENRDWHESIINSNNVIKIAIPERAYHLQYIPGTDYLLYALPQIKKQLVLYDVKNNYSTILQFAHEIQDVRVTQDGIIAVFDGKRIHIFKNVWKNYKSPNDIDLTGNSNKCKGNQVIEHFFAA